MGGLKNTGRRLKNVVSGRGYMTDKERYQKQKGKRTAAKDKMFQNAALPDEEEIRLVERRKAAKRKGSRVKTVLTDLNRLG